PVGTVVDDDREIEAGRLPARDGLLLPGDDAGELLLAPGDEVVAEENLKDGRVTPRALGIELLHELLEGELLVGEPTEHRHLHPRDELTEAGVAAQIGPQ